MSYELWSYDSQNSNSVEDKRSKTLNIQCNSQWFPSQFSREHYLPIIKIITRATFIGPTAVVYGKAIVKVHSGHLNECLK